MAEKDGPDTNRIFPFSTITVKVGESYPVIMTLHWSIFQTDLAQAEPRNCRANYWLQESRFSHSHSYEAEVVKLAQKANVAPAPHVGYSPSGLSHR